MLELKNITKSYKIGETKQKVLKGINIKFRRNEFTSILGSSGSGKTTLLNIIGGLDKYDDGDLIIEGISTKKYYSSDWDAYRNHRVGFIFQSYNLIMHQSVLQNVEIALTLSGVSKSERKSKAIEALKKVGLKDHINKKPNQLSGGQMQRVAIARALVNDPEIILADEPTGALDSVTSVQIMDLLKEIAKDKLVIMVTHNPDIAKEYSTRIIELKDGVIVNDSNPYKNDKEEFQERKITKTSMSLLSALSLSFNNLLTKKGRTFLTAFAGSIGIIGIALILSLSNGVNKYAKNLEKDSLSDYPISIEKVSYDLFGSLTETLDEAIKEAKCDKNKLCSRDDLVKTSITNEKGLEKRNNVKEFKKYIENNKEFEKYSESINYTYNIDLQVYTNDYIQVNPSSIDESESNIFNELDNKDTYKVLAGKLPKKKNEVVLIVGSDKRLNDSLLYALNIKDRKVLAKDLENIRKDKNYKVKNTKYSYKDILNKKYKLILNTDKYIEENGIFVDNSNNQEYLNSIIDKGLDLVIVGIIEDKNASSAHIAYTHDLTLHVIREVSKTDIYKKQLSNKKINVLTGLEFDGVIDTYESIASKLGIYEESEPSSINIYPKDYNSKEKLTKLIEEYNEKNEKNKKEDLVITYQDVMKTLVGGITKVVDIVSFVLIGFIAISLIVSSIMIAIITYISVLERTKEIGILRAIGASRKDVRRVFYAETIIEGLIAGCLGVGIAFLITIPINGIVGAVADIKGIASMSLKSSIFLILLSVALNVIAGMSPAGVAAKKDPVEALRTE